MVEERDTDGATALVRSLQGEGVRHVFGIISTHMLEAYDAVLRLGGPALISGNHESALIYEADGYWRASGKPGVAFTSTGPGVANSVGAMGEAYACSSAVLNITSSMPRQCIGSKRGYLHETKDQTGMLRTVTEWTRLVDATDGIAPAIASAFDYFSTARPRPLAIEIPIDLWTAPTTAAEPQSEQRSALAFKQESELERATALIRQARRPVIWAGGGVVSAGAFRELRTLAETMGAPVIVTVGGKSSFSADHALYVATAWTVGSVKRSEPVSRLIEAADLVLAVGSRFARGSTMNWTLKLPANLIQIDIDGCEIGKNYPVAVGLRGDAGAVLQRLNAALASMRHTGISEEYQRIAAKARTEHEAQLRKQGTAQCRILDGIRSAIPREAIIASDPTVLFSRWANVVMPAYSERSWICAHGWTGIGFAFPAAIGARVGSGSRPVITFSGDGGFQFNLQELATVKSAGLEQFVAVVLNDGFYGALRDQQAEKCNGRHIGVKLWNPDYVRLAEAYGIEGVRVRTLSDLMRWIGTGFARREPLLIEAILSAQLNDFAPL